MGKPLSILEGRCDCCQNFARLVPDTGLCGACYTGEADMFEPAIGACVEQNLTLTLSDMDETLKADKGWVRYSNQGQEYVYEYCVKNSDIRIKVQSGISVQTKQMDCPGLDAIRIFAILYVEAKPGRQKFVRGLCKARVVRPGGDWKDRLKRAYEDTLAEARGRSPRAYH